MAIEFHFLISNLGGGRAFLTFLESFILYLFRAGRHIKIVAQNISQLYVKASRPNECMCRSRSFLPYLQNQYELVHWKKKFKLKLQHQTLFLLASCGVSSSSPLPTPCSSSMVTSLLSSLIMMVILPVCLLWIECLC